MQNDEIKEILDKLNNGKWEKDTEEITYKILFSGEVYKLYDYITNLQQENEIRQQDINNLTYQLAKEKEENERLKEELVKIPRAKMEYDLELQDYKSRCEKANDKIQYIIDYGFDYDGFNTVESLKGLIDMLVDYARESKNILQNGSEINDKN